MALMQRHLKVYQLRPSRFESMLTLPATNRLRRADG